MNIALLGFGVVGKGVYDIITNDHPEWNIKYIVELDDNKLGDLVSLRPISFEHVLIDEKIDTVIELIGGKTIAYTFIKQALEHKKNVVTANKAVISEHFKELTLLAKQNNVSLLYEASVGGAIIVLDPLFKIAQINKINKIEGIINGSTNFVLSNIFLNNKTLDDSLGEALKLGYIETGSTDDMDGYDLMRKINILSMISYQTYINEEDITRVPLSSLTKEFIEYVKSKNKIIKYIATSTLNDDKISIHLEPTILDKSNFYSMINYEENIISTYGQYHNKQSFIGQGAGRYPTASAVVNDCYILLNQEKREHEFAQEFEINNRQLYSFLVQQNNTFKVVKNCSIIDLQADQDITCFARIEGEEL